MFSGICRDGSALEVQLLSKVSSPCTETVKRCASNRKDSDYSIINPLQSQMLYMSQAFPSVLPAICFFFSLFDHLHSLQIVQTPQFFAQHTLLRKEKKKCIFLLLQAECRHVVQHSWPDFCPFFPIAIHVAKLKMARYNDRVKPANLWKDLSICNVQI